MRRTYKLHLSPPVTGPAVDLLVIDRSQVYPFFVMMPGLHRGRGVPLRGYAVLVDLVGSRIPVAAPVAGLMRVRGRRHFFTVTDVPFIAIRGRGGREAWEEALYLSAVINSRLFAEKLGEALGEGDDPLRVLGRLVSTIPVYIPERHRLVARVAAEIRGRVMEYRRTWINAVTSDTDVSPRLFARRFVNHLGRLIVPAMPRFELLIASVVDRVHLPQYGSTAPRWEDATEER